MSDNLDQVLTPIHVTVSRWICPFCRRGRSRAKACMEHMARCFKNPALRGCKTCANYLGFDKCAAGFNIRAGVVTKCSKWKEDGGG